MSKKIIHEDVEQKSIAWFQLRCGKITASELSNILQPKKLELSSTAKEKAYELAVERILGISEEGVTTPIMEYGNEMEIVARQDYNDNFNKVREVGFVENNSFGFQFGCSPDGLFVDGSSAIEIKSLCGKKYMKAILDNEIDPKHILQMQSTMLICEIPYMDYIAYHEGLILKPIRVEANEDIQAKIIAAGRQVEIWIQEAIRRYNEVKPLGYQTQMSVEI